MLNDVKILNRDILIHCLDKDLSKYNKQADMD